MSSAPTASAGRPDDRRPAAGRVAVLAALTTAVALALTVAGGAHLSALVRVPGIGFASLAVAFAIAEALPVHYEHRREAVSITLSIVPLVVGLYAADPVTLIGARLAGSAVVLILHRRNNVMKLSVNLASFWVQTAVSVLVFRAGVGHGLGASGWPAVFGAVLAGDAAQSAVLTGAISLYQRRWEQTLASSALVSGAAAVVETSVGLVAVTLLVSEPIALLPLAVVVSMVLLSYRTHQTLRDQHTQLGHLYDFTSVMSDAVLEGQVVRTLLDQARDLMHAERAELCLVDGDGLVSVRGGGDGTVGFEPAGAGLAALHTLAHESGGPVIIGAGHGGDRRLAAGIGAEQVLAAPLTGAGEGLGTLLVADRSGDVRGFTPDDLRVLATLANHAGASLENSRLLDRLRKQVVDSEYQSLHDALTGLPNRALFGRNLQGAIDHGANAAVLLLDLDRFKEVNDTLGHHNGDLLLQQVGVRLRDALRRGDIVARLGGDEFGVLLPDIGGETAAVQVARGIIELLEQPFVIGDMSVDVGASIGIAISPRHGADPGTLMQRADVALYTAKADQSGVEIYQRERDGYSPERLSLVGELRRAVSEEQLEVHFQPQVDLSDRSVVGVEALVRWNHPTRGMISPDDFVSVAEHTGVIGPLTQFVLDRSLAACRDWRRRGHPVRVSVNLSARTLLHDSVVDDVAALLTRHGVPAESLCLEVTESSIMSDPRRTIATLESLRNLGVTIAVDDFGTGHSSLAYIKRLPVGEIKIDRSFVGTMLNERSDEAIVSTILSLARNLGIPVVAEGVEDEETAAALAEMGCPAAQGFLFGRPMSAGSLTAWLAGRPQAQPGSAVIVPIGPGIDRAMLGTAGRG